MKSKYLKLGLLFLLLFIIWTVLIITVDVQPIGVNGSSIGLATLNTWFHNFTGVHMWMYVITDWLGLVPVFTCVVFGIIGFIQLIQRKSLFKVDFDLLVLGIYYIIVILSYLIFEMIPINYRPIFIEGKAEISYPSSTTLLVLSVMPTLVFQVKHRCQNHKIKKLICILTNIFSILMVFARLISGVHWLSDIIGSVLISFGYYYLYKAIVGEDYGVS